MTRVKRNHHSYGGHSGVAKRPRLDDRLQCETSASAAADALVDALGIGDDE